MADVKIVDIDSTQWNIKDQEARNRIATLEGSLIPQSLGDIDINLNVGFTATKAKLVEHYKVGKIHFAKLDLRDISGGLIGTSETSQIGTINIYPKKETVFFAYDYKNNAMLRCYLATDRTIRIAESVGVVPGNNICMGELIFAEA